MLNQPVRASFFSSLLDGPLQDFYQRTKQLRAVMSTIEAAGRGHATVQTQRVNACLDVLGSETSNTVNSMAITFLASSYEEFIRQEIGQCAIFLTERYSSFHEKTRRRVKNLYWQECISHFGRRKSIIEHESHELNSKALAEINIAIVSADKFVVNDDASGIVSSILSQHSRNFKPQIVDQIAARLGIPKLIDSAADSNRLRAHFGVTQKKDVSRKLVSSMNEFYDLRNEIVHRLDSSVGYGVDFVVRYIELFEAATESIKIVLSRAVDQW